MRNGNGSAWVYGVLAAGAFTFSFSPIMIRFAGGAAGGEAPGLAVAAWRTMMAAVALAPFAWVHARAEIKAIGRREWGMIVPGGILLGLHFVLWIESLYHTTVAAASVLITTSPVFLAALGYVFLKERLSRPVHVAIAVAVVGAAVIGAEDMFAPGGGGTLFGNGLALLGSLLFSVYLLLGRVVRQKHSWLAYVFPLYAIAALTTLGMAVLLGTPLWGFEPLFYVLCAALALGPQIMGHGAFNYAVRYVSAAPLGMLGLVEPIGASLLAYMIFSEAPSGTAMAGMLTTLIAIAFVILYRRRTPASGPGAD